MDSFLWGYDLQHHIIPKYKNINVPSCSVIIPVLKCTMTHKYKIFKIHHSKPVTSCCHIEGALYITYVLNLYYFCVKL